MLCDQAAHRARAPRPRKRGEVSRTNLEARQLARELSIEPQRLCRRADYSARAFLSPCGRDLLGAGDSHGAAPLCPQRPLAKRCAEWNSSGIYRLASGVAWL